MYGADKPRQDRLPSEQLAGQSLSCDRLGLARLLPVTAGGAARLYVLHDDNALRFVDPVQGAPLDTETCAVEAGQLVPERFSDPIGDFKERAGDELDRSSGHVFRKQFGDRATSRACHSELVRLLAQRLRSASSARAASVP